MPFFLPPLPCFLRSFTALPKDFKSLAAMNFERVVKKCHLVVRNEG